MKTKTGKPRTQKTTARTRVKLIVQSPSDRNTTILIPYAVAWAAARGIARDTHYAVILFGEYGTAHFNHADGGGYVEWNDKSTMPGETTRFDERTRVAI
jgi:hypothetical protein